MFCVDNVNPLYSEEDVIQFVTSLRVTVVSCFEVKPRVRYSDHGEDRVHRKAFRLCINSDDSVRLLDASKWPASVATSEYFFKKKNLAYSNPNERNSWRDKDVSRDSVANLPTTFGLTRSESLQSQSSLQITAEQNKYQNNDMDATILTPYSP